MSDKSAIEWTDATYNPIRGIPPNRHMCSKISPGCDNCYASTMTRRFGGQEFPQHRTDVAVRLDEKALMLPLAWKEPRMVFVCSMTDLFGEWVPQAWVDQILEVMLKAEQHQFQVLTKRPSRMAEMLSTAYDRLFGPHARRYGDNIWLGTSIELDRYTWRANVLRECPAAVRFISAEPLLGPLPSLDLTGIDWLLTGGESGARHRPMDLQWARDLRDRCQAAGVAYFHKQNGGRTHTAGGRLLDGREWNEFPPVREAVLA